MKKICFSSLLLMFVIASHAQLKISGVNPHPINIQTHGKNPSLMTIDTLWPPVFQDPCLLNDPTPFTYYSLGGADQGYVSGNCLVSGTAVGAECAERYTFSGSGTINEVLVAYAYVTGTTGSTSAKIYSLNAVTKKPQTVIRESAVLTTGNISTSAYTSYAFAPPVSVTTDFAVSAVFPTNGDTVAVTSTKLDCHSSDSLGALNFVNYGWYFYTFLFGNVPPADTSIDVMIFPVVEASSGINEYPSSNGLSLLGAYPNPAKSFTEIRYQITNPSVVSVKVFSLNGSIIRQFSGKRDAGSHDIKISLKDIAAGNYYYTIKTENAQLTGKFVVQ